MISTLRPRFTTGAGSGFAICACCAAATPAATIATSTNEMRIRIVILPFAYRVPVTVPASYAIRPFTMVIVGLMSLIWSAGMVR